MDTAPLMESHNAEAIQAGAVAEEAKQKAFHVSIVTALKEVLDDNSGDGSRPILIKRIPLICNDIRDIKADLRWMKIIGGALATAALGLAFKSFTG